MVRGKAALRHYWATALKLLPDLHFEVVGVYRGESVLVINYRNHRGELVNEVLTFDGDPGPRGPWHVSGVLNRVETAEDRTLSRNAVWAVSEPVSPNR